LREREYWDAYQEAYEDMIRETASEEAPWYVVPADHKWFTQVVVAAVIVETLKSLKLAPPKLTDEQREALDKARKALTK
jgi:polyphosphate kinase 2 (PPK2 family)